jgi:DNA-binding SARP family transcriptional activator
VKKIMTKLMEAMESAYSALVEHIPHFQVVLLHPESRYRSVTVARLINDPERQSYYYALEPDNITLRAFIESMTRQLSTQNAIFGRHLNLIPPTAYGSEDGNFTLILETLARELAELSDREFVLVLDEYDRSDEADDVHWLMEHLVNLLPPQCHLVINSRTMPRLPWLAMIAKRQAVLLLDSTPIEREFYMPRRQGPTDLQVFGLGQSYVMLDGRLIDSWEGHLPRLLFFFALDRPMVTRSEICAAFWPELRLEQAVNVFHVTKRRLHKALDKIVLVHNENFYQVNPELNIYYDINEFVELLVEGRNPATPKPFEIWKKVVSLYKGAFLQGHEDSWVQSRRAAFRAGYLEALSAMAMTFIGREQRELALKLYLQALDEDYSREDIHREVMNLYQQLGRGSEAVAHFNALETRFQQSRQSLSAETISLYKRISA